MQPVPVTTTPPLTQPVSVLVSTEMTLGGMAYDQKTEQVSVALVPASREPLSADWTGPAGLVQFTLWAKLEGTPGAAPRKIGTITVQT